MMNEAPDLERKKMALLTAIADGRLITDANATQDERMTINAMLDGYITKFDPSLASYAAGTLPTSPFNSKLRAVQQSLGIGVDGKFGEKSIMGIVRAGGGLRLEDILGMFPATPPSGPAATTFAELSALIDQGNKGNPPFDLGPGIVGSTGTGSMGVKVGPGPKVGLGSVLSVVPQVQRMFTPARLDVIKRTAQAMQARGQDPLDYLRRELGAKSPELGRMNADLLLASMGIPAPK